MSDEFIDVDSEGVYLGITPEEFGVRIGRASSPLKTGENDGNEAIEGATIVPRKQLKESIEHLREELASGEPLTGEDRAELEGVLGEVSGILDSNEGEHATRKDFFSELGELVERFEVTHPKLAIVLGRIADSLSQLGI
ncbi:MAG TPA: DUF4404 family protein [Deltaproteobacteria bacterium]|nr:DUF4404 family protein [Deltaproteobacteria bacterium]